MDFHQRGAVIELHQLTVGAYVQRVPDPALGQRIQGFGDLGVEIAVYLDRFEHRHVIGPGTGSSRGCSSVVNTSRGRAQVVPWMRVPAVRRHQVITACCACSRLVNVSPSQKFRRTYWTMRSTRGLSWGRCGVECTNRIPSFAQARNNQASTNADPGVDAGRNSTSGQRRFQSDAQPDGVLAEAEPIAADQPGMIVQESEQIGFAATNLRATQRIPGPPIIGVLGLEPAEHRRDVPGGRADQLEAVKQAQQRRLRR